MKLIWLVTALIYLALAKISFLTVLPTASSGPALAWLPTGFAVAAILIYGYKIWPGIFLGSILNASLLNPSAILGFTIANTLDPFLAVWIPRRLMLKEIDFNRRRDLVTFVLSTICISSVISACVGVATLLLVHAISSEHALLYWLVWWVSDALSVLILTPLIMAWRNITKIQWTSQLVTEILVGAAAAAAMIALIIWMPLGNETIHFVYWIFPFVIWLSFRLGFRGTTMGIFLLSAVVVCATSMGFGPFIGHTTEMSFLYVQSFLAVTSLLGLFLVATVKERDAAIRDRDDCFLMASHELNTPLTVLRMQSYFLRQLIENKEFGGMSIEKRLELIKINSREIDKLSSLVDELLEGSRICSGKMDVEPVSMDLEVLVNEVVREHSEEIHRSGVLVNVKSHGPIRGIWDHSKIKFVMKTLLRNALKYGEGKPINISLEQRDNKARLVVEDFGMGIPRDQLHRIFERFGRVAQVKSFGGLGQGLFISKAIINAHRGKIEVESKVGKGTIFRVELPV